MNTSSLNVSIAGCCSTRSARHNPAHAIFMRGGYAKDLSPAMLTYCEQAGPLAFRASEALTDQYPVVRSVPLRQFVARFAPRSPVMFVQVPRRLRCLLLHSRVRQ